MSDDFELLRRYAEANDQAAFAEWVQRHLGLVYTAALRRLRGDAHAAADVTQQVFVAAARHAPELARHSTVTGWLYTATRNAAFNFMRNEERRRQRERTALDLAPDITDGDVPAWTQVKPMLDAAIDELGGADREAVLLRFFEGRGFAEIGQHLRVSENAARMRVERALNKLHALLARRALTSTAAALGAVLVHQAGAATGSVPVGLAGSVTSAALAGAESGIGAGVVLSFMSATKTTILASGAAMLCALLGVGWQKWETRQARDAAQAARSETAAITARTAVIAREADAAESAAKAMSDKLSAAPPRVTPSNAPAPARALAVQPSARDPNWDPVNAGRGLMERHPELKRAVFARTDAVANFTWAPLFRELGLSEAEQEEYRTLMREHGGISAPFGPGGEVYSFYTGMDIGADTFTARQKEILGETGYARLPEFHRMNEARGATAKLASALAFTETPVSSEQAQRLAGLMMDSARNADTNRVDPLKWDVIMERASGVLTPPQLAALAEVRSDEERRRANMRSVPMRSTKGDAAK